jgi:hypothetical protein
LNLADGCWCFPGGAATQFKSEDIDLRWYPDTQTITLTLKLLNFWSRSHCISNSITSNIKKRKLFAASRESFIFYENLWDEDY